MKLDINSSSNYKMCFAFRRRIQPMILTYDPTCQHRPMYTHSLSQPHTRSNNYDLHHLSLACRLKYLTFLYRPTPSDHYHSFTRLNIGTAVYSLSKFRLSFLPPQYLHKHRCRVQTPPLSLDELLCSDNATLSRHLDKHAPTIVKSDLTLTTLGIGHILRIFRP